MGNRTPNMSIYEPQNGEDLYGRAFLAGLNNIDAHDHSGAPYNGVQIGTNGIQDGAITPPKLSEEIIIEVEGQTTNATPVQIAFYALPESTMVTITGRVAALRDDATECAGGTFVAVFLRSTGSSVEQISSQNLEWKKKSTGNITFQVIADIPNESASLQLVGEAG